MYCDCVDVTEIVNHLKKIDYKALNTVVGYNKLRARRLNGYLVGKYTSTSRNDDESLSDAEKRILENIKIK